MWGGIIFFMALVVIIWFLNLKNQLLIINKQESSTFQSAEKQVNSIFQIFNNAKTDFQSIK